MSTKTKPANVAADADAQDDPHGLTGDCPACLVPLPPFWKDEARSMFFCCGKYTCSSMECILTCRKVLFGRRISEFTKGPAGVGVLNGEMMSKKHCPFCLTKLYECHSGRLFFTRELQDLVAQNACREKKAWAQRILAFEHLGMIRRPHNESPGDNLIVGGVRDVQRGIELLRLSAKQGHPQAMYHLARKYYHGISGLEKSIEKAIPLLEASLIQGQAISGVFLYGIYKRQGSLKKAISCLELASKFGEGHSSYMVGDAYEEGTHDLTKDKYKAFHYFKLGAQQGYVHAQMVAATLCRELLGDEEQEIKFLKMATEQGNADAQLCLGLRYVDGMNKWIKSENWPAGVQMLRRARAGGCQQAADVLDDIEMKTTCVCFLCYTKAPQGVKFRRCGRCRTVFYCNEQCQKIAWSAGHKNSCVKHDG